MALWILLALAGTQVACESIVGITERTERALPGGFGGDNLAGNSGVGGNAGVGGVAGAGGFAGDAGAGGGGGAAGDGGAGGDAGSGGDAGTGGSGDCLPPAGGDAQLRLGNLSPKSGAVSFCLKPSTAVDYGASVPWPRGFGASCAPGLSYLQVTRSFGIEPGDVDIKVIDAGATDCSAEAITEAKGLKIEAGARYTLLSLGGVNTGALLRLLPEKKALAGAGVRMVNAVDFAGPLFFGLSSSDKLPASISPIITEALPLGGVPKKNDNAIIGQINEAGYLEVLPIDFNLGVTRAGSSNAMMVAGLSPKGDGSSTLYAVGTRNDPAFPLQGLTCDESTDTGTLYLDCKLTEPPPARTITVDAVTVGLYGAFAPYEKERRPYVFDQIAQLGSDVVCIQEIYTQEDRNAMAVAAKNAGVYLHWFSPVLDFSALPTDPEDADGKIPELPTATCSSGTAAIASQNALNCAQKNCVEPLNDPKGTLPSGNAGCLSSKCAAAFTTLLASPNLDNKRCYTCIIANLVSYRPIEDIKADCNTNPQAAFAHLGMGSTMMLSRFPIKETETYVLPSTMFRRTVLRATLQMPDEELVDVYCGHLSFVHGSTVPYTGLYGKGLTTPVGWVNEQLLQAQRWVQFVKDRSKADRLVIIAGDAASSKEYKDASPPIPPLHPETFLTLEQSFFSGTAPGYTPACTICSSPENTYGGNSNAWTTFILTGGTVKPLIQSSSRTLKEQIVPIKDNGKDFLGNVSDNFGFRSVIQLPY